MSLAKTSIREQREGTRFRGKAAAQRGECARSLTLSSAFHKVTTLYKVGGRSLSLAEIEKPTEKIRERCRDFADNRIFQTTATIFTLYALFGDDIRYMATGKDADIYFNVLTITAIVIFTVEIVTCSIGKTGYWLSFFFSLDMIATVSLPLDITWISEAWFHQTDMEASDEGGSSNSNSLRASRASRAGSRAGRVVRLIRLIRLLRIIKLYKMHLEQAKKKELQVLGEMRDVDDDEEQDVTHESRVGKKLTEMTTRRVIIIVLLMLLCSPLWRVKDGLLKSGELQADGPQLALNQVSDAFLRYTEELQLNPNSTIVPHFKRIYERKLLLLIYYNNPHATEAECVDSRTGEKLQQCYSPAETLDTLYWIGYRVPASWEAEYVRVTPSSHAFDWDNIYRSPQDEGFRAGPLKDFAKNRLTSPWVLECTNPSTRGVSFSAENACPSELRPTERQFYMASANKDKLGFIIYMDQTKHAKLEAVWNVILTLFVVVVLASGSWMFSRDANNLVLFPVERMMARMAKIRHNPFEAMKMSEEQYHKELHAAAVRKSRFSKFIPTSWHWMFAGSSRENNEKDRQKKNEAKSKIMETVLLEKTIIKLGGLCALGFGEAGSTIIASNMQGGQSADITVMVPGRRVNAIFGFCDIRNFTDVTEILQDSVMVFVNQISEIVHTLVDEHRGASNKNIGDAFLLVWRLDVDAPKWLTTRTADLSIMCFVRIVAWTNMSPGLAAYRTHESLIARMPNYRVRMGYGLHLGWAIEGAIGSEFKIDASYLSKNVNMSARLESATKQYEVLMLFSDTLVNTASPDMQEQCRKIDRVIAKGGSRLPFCLYTVDLDYQSLPISPIADQKTIRVGVMNRCLFTGAKLTRKYKYETRAARESRKKEYVQRNYRPSCGFNDDSNLKTMRRRYIEHPEFRHGFAMAFYNYVSGEWAVARQMLSDLQSVLPPPYLPPGQTAAAEKKEAKQKMATKRKQTGRNQCVESKGERESFGTSSDFCAIDGPSAALLRFMKQYDYIAPKNWQGYREMD